MFKKLIPAVFCVALASAAASADCTWSWTAGTGFITVPCNVESTGNNKMAMDTLNGYFWISNPTSPNSYQGAAYDRLGFGFNANVALITTQSTGTARPIQISPQFGNGLFLATNGNVGVNTTNPQARLEVMGNNKMAMDTLNGYLWISNPSPPNSYQGGAYDRIGVGFAGDVAHLFTDSTTTLRPMQIHVGANAGLYLTPNGLVGVNTTAPSSTLDVNGNIHASGSITAASVVGATYQDLAEWVPAATELEPGAVVVLNPSKSNEVMRSTRRYDTTVAGVVSAQPGIILGEASASKAKIATTGRVKVHVDATRSPIVIGDLLVTGDKPGTAMRSVPVEIAGIAMHRPGTVIGKALEPLASGEGDILVLLSLQ